MSSTTGASPTVEESVGGGEDAGVPRVWDAVGALVARSGRGGSSPARRLGRARNWRKSLWVGRRWLPPRGIGAYPTRRGRPTRCITEPSRATSPRRRRSVGLSGHGRVLPTSPAATKEVFDTAGMSLVRGVRPSERAEQLRRARRQAATSTPRSTLPQGCMRGTCLPRSFPRRSRPD